jgi:phosphoenolpyruvate carboxylase
VAAVLGRLQLRPVFTAHPTEAASRTLLTKLRRVAELFTERSDPRRTDTDRKRIDRRVAELIDQIWQTDELRAHRPTPMDEASSAIFYLDQLSDVIPDLVDEIDVQLSRLGDSDGFADPDPLRNLGGGRPRRQPERHPRVDDAGARDAARARAQGSHRARRGGSRGVVDVGSIHGISEELAQASKSDREALPVVWERFKVLNADEPYRLKCAYIHQRLRNTQRRIAGDSRHIPGKDYLTTRTTARKICG